jgi:hypothetical protein
MHRIIKLLAIAAGTGLALAAGVAAADEVKVIKAPGVLDAKKVVRDADTGKLRPATEEEAAAMGSATNRFAPNVAVISRPTTTMVTRPDGSATIRRSIEDLDSLVATRTADGKLAVKHGKHAPAATNLPKE